MPRHSRKVGNAPTLGLYPLALRAREAEPHSILFYERARYRTAEKPESKLQPMVGESQHALNKLLKRDLNCYFHASLPTAAFMLWKCSFADRRITTSRNFSTVVLPPKAGR